MKVDITTHQGKHIGMQSENIDSLVGIIEGLKVKSDVTTPFAEVEISSEGTTKITLESLDAKELIHMIRLIASQDS